jgi:transporter family-2 protein
MMQALCAVLALAHGASVALQGATNAALRGRIGLGAAMVVNTAPILAAAVLIALADGSWSRLGALRTTPPHLFLGGAYGFLIVIAAIIVFPRLGAAPTLMLVVAAQLAVALALDHAGAFGLPVAALSWRRVIGVATMLAGLALALKR